MHGSNLSCYHGPPGVCNLFLSWWFTPQPQACRLGQSGNTSMLVGGIVITPSQVKPVFNFGYKGWNPGKMLTLIKYLRTEIPLWTPTWSGHLYTTDTFICLDEKLLYYFCIKLTHLIWTLVNTDNGHFSVSQVTNSHISSTLLYRCWLPAHCLFSSFCSLDLFL